MGDIQTMVRTEMEVDGRSYFLAQGQDVGLLKRRVEEAVNGPAAFVDFVVVGNRSVSLLVSAGARVIFSVETVQIDARDTGDEDFPYGGAYDPF